MIIKRGQVKILHILDDDEELDDKETKKALKKAKQDAKNINKDGNKIKLNKESDK